MHICIRSSPVYIRKLTNQGATSVEETSSIVERHQGSKLTREASYRITPALKQCLIVQPDEADESPYPLKSGAFNVLLMGGG